MDLYLNDYELVFQEDFSGGLETNKWKADDSIVAAHSAKKSDVIPSHVVTDAVAKHDGSKMYYNPENVTVEESELVIKINKSADGFEGGSVTCNGLVFDRGYVEVEVKFPKSQKGVWPVFGLVATDGYHYKPSYDIAAVLGDKGKNATNMYLKWIDEIYEKHNKVNCFYGKPKRFWPEGDETLSDGYHTFGVELAENHIIFYADGTETKRVNVDNASYEVFKKSIFLKFTASVSVGLPQIPAPESDISLPDEFKIRSIKLYQRPGNLLVKR